MNTLISIFLLSFLQLIGAENEITLTFVGDAMQHTPQISSARQSDGSYDYSKCFEIIEDDISSADFAVANLECTLGGTPYTGYPCFSAPEEFAMQLKNSGFDLLCTANNHCLDRRDAGLKRTIEKLKSMDIPHTGTFSNQAARDSAAFYITDIKGVKMAFLSYTYGTNGIPVQRDAVVNFLDRAKMSKDIKAARAAGAMIVSVHLHWGIEYKLLPNKDQRELADFLVDEGVDLIIGGHPHVIQPMEVRHSSKWDKDVLVVYSMGNFISNQMDTDSRGGAMVKVTLAKTYDRISIKNAGYKLFFVQKPGGSQRFYQLIPSHLENLLRPDSKPQFKQFIKNARKIFQEHNINVPEIME